MSVVRHKAGRAADLVVGALLPPLVTHLAVWLRYVHRPERHGQRTALTASNLDFVSVRERLIEEVPFEERNLTFDFSGKHDRDRPEVMCEPARAETAHVEPIDDVPGRFCLVVQPDEERPAGPLKFKTGAMTSAGIRRTHTAQVSQRRPVAGSVDRDLST